MTQRRGNSNAGNYNPNINVTGNDIQQGMFFYLWKKYTLRIDLIIYFKNVSIQFNLFTAKYWLSWLNSI